MSTKKFPTDVVLSAVTGVLVTPKFGDVHECIEHMAGGPIWTHQLPSWFKANREKLREAFPDLADFDMTGLKPDTAAAWAAEREHILSEERDVPVIGGQPSSPFEGLEGKDVIAVAV